MLNRVLSVAVLTAVVFICVSCTISRNDFTILPQEAPEIADISVLIDRIEGVHLFSSSGDAVAPVQKILVLPEGRLLVMDTRKNVHIYSSEGGNLLRVGRIGRGPGEYVALQDIAFDPESNRIALLCSGKVMEYDLSGNYLASYELPKINYDAIASFKDGFCLFAAAPNHEIEDLETAHNTVHFYSRAKMDIIKETLPRKDYILNTEMISYSAGTGYYLRPLEGENVLYKIEDSRIEKTMVVSFGKDQSPEKSLLRDGKYDIGNYVMSPYYKMPMNFQFTDRHFIFSAIGPGGVMYYYLYDKDRSPIARWNEHEDCLSPVKIVSSDADSVYFLINDPSYWKQLDMETLDPLMKAVMSNCVITEDSPFIFRLFLK